MKRTRHSWTGTPFRKFLCLVLALVMLLSTGLSSIAVAVENDTRTEIVDTEDGVPEEPAEEIPEEPSADEPDAGEEASAAELGEEQGEELPEEPAKPEVGSEGESGETPAAEPVEEPTENPIEEPVEEPAEGKREATPEIPDGAKAGETSEQDETTRDGEGESEADTWTVTFYNRDAQVYETVEVVKGEAIGNQLPETIARQDYDAFWAVGEIVQGGQGQEIKVTEPVTKIGSDYVPDGDMTVVPYYEKIEYTITFYKDENKTGTVDTKTVNVDTSYCLNDIPQVPVKNGYAGRWMYADGLFNNYVHVNEKAAADRTLDVWAEYDQNVFTVQFIVGSEAYETDTYNKNETLTLPSDPVVEGKDFIGWFDSEDNEYVGGESVTEDIELHAQFKDQYYVRFVILDDDGNPIETLSQYFRSKGEAIGTMPQNPFVAGKVFQKWVVQGTGTEVKSDTIVNESFTAVAVFRTVTVYKITAEYYYIGSNGEVVFNTDLLQVEEHELPYTITAPSSTKTDPNEVSGAPIYYPETPTVTVTDDKFDSNKECTVRIKYVPYTAEYDFVYKVKDLTGNGYTEIPDSREHVYGVLNSYVTPTVKTFEHYELELAQGADITQAEGQELVVTYTRKNYQLTYDTKGGSYVAGVTVPYGTQQTVTSTVPTRNGYTFAGWYTDESCTQAAA